MKVRYKKLLFALTVGGAALLLPANTPIAEGAEVQIQELPMVGGAERVDAELSGLAWLGDDLVLLPQYPDRFPTAEGGGVFVLGRAEIERAIEDRGEVEPRRVPFIAEGFEDAIVGFEGFEAIAFLGSEVFVTVEADAPEGTHGYLVKGRVREGLSAIELDVESRVMLDAQSPIGNLAYEALSIHDGRIYVFYEANGAANPTAQAECFDRDLERMAPLALSRVEYRLTDTTAVDENGRFWAANYYYDGDCWKTGSCPIRERFGVGRSHRGQRTVERFIELQLGADGIEPTDTAPVQLELGRGSGRNWEGIVRMDDLGFLVVTDKHPTSMLAFVPFPA